MNCRNPGLFILFFVGLAPAVFGQGAPVSQYLAAGDKLLAEKNYPKAIEYYQYALKLDPQSAAAYEGLGDAYYYSGAEEEALAAYEKALQLKPDNPRVDSLIEILKNRKKDEVAPGGDMEPGGGSTPPGYKAELTVMAGISTTNIASNFSIGNVGSFNLSNQGSGAAMRVGFVLNPYLILGGSLASYSFGSSAVSLFNYNYYSWDYYQVTLQSVEFTVFLKYRLTSGNIRPYLVGAAGLTKLNSSVSDTLGYQPTSSNSTFNLLLEAGGGLEFQLLHNFSLFAESRFENIFGNGGALTYNGTSFNAVNGSSFYHVPVEMGATFDFF